MQFKIKCEDMADNIKFIQTSTRFASWELYFLFLLQECFPRAWNIIKGIKLQFEHFFHFLNCLWSVWSEPARLFLCMFVFYKHLKIHWNQFWVLGMYKKRMYVCTYTIANEYHSICEAVMYDIFLHIFIFHQIWW